MNWNSWIWRTVIAFFTLFLGAYLVPGLSAFTLLHLLIVSVLVAYLATAGENVILADTVPKKSMLLLVVSALTIYLYALALLRERLPVVSTLLVAAVITGIDYLFKVRESDFLAEGTGGESQQETGS